MPTIKILSEAELRDAVQLDLNAIDCIEAAFSALADGHVVMPPILSMAIKDFNGEVDVKTAYVPGVDSFAVKMSPGYFDNPKLGLPSTSGLMILSSVQTGMLEALLLDNGYLTDIRTAAAGAVAAKHLARADAARATLIGGGLQTRLQLKALCLVRTIREVLIWARNQEQAEFAASELSQELNINVKASDDIENAVKSADIVVTTTPSIKPLVMADWLQPGQHITAMGSDQPHKQELDAACIARADCYVPDRQSQTALLGELHHALNACLIAPDRKFAELGEIVTHAAPGRTNARDITLCDLTGTGVQDTAIASYARERADDAGSGTEFTS